jgi:hypothetical protein
MDKMKLLTIGISLLVTSVFSAKTKDSALLKGYLEKNNYAAAEPLAK